MKIRPGSWCAIVVWVFIIAGACGSSRDTLRPPQADLPNALLWEINSEDLDSPSYLFGTIHIIPTEMFLWPEDFQEAFDSSDQVVMEVGEPEIDPASMMELLPRIMMSEELSLENLVSTEEYARVESYFENIGMPMMFINKIKPFFPYMLVEIDFANLMEGDMKSYEQEIAAWARADEKTILGLETIDYQMSLFDSIPYKDQAMLLVQAIDEKSGDPDASLQNSDVMFQTYINQDLNGLLEQVTESDGPLAKYNNLFLDDRNRNWIPKIESMIRRQSSFIAVGAGHLPGENGVIQLLKAKGYTLTPIMQSENGTH